MSWVIWFDSAFFKLIALVGSPQRLVQVGRCVLLISCSIARIVPTTLEADAVIIMFLMFRLSVLRLASCSNDQTVILWSFHATSFEVCARITKVDLYFLLLLDKSLELAPLFSRHYSPFIIYNSLLFSYCFFIHSFIAFLVLFPVFLVFSLLFHVIPVFSYILSLLFSFYYPVLTANSYTGFHCGMVVCGPGGPSGSLGACFSSGLASYPRSD